MAGFYPDVPAPKMAYDRDGTIGIKRNSSSYFSEAELRNLNDESTSTVTHNGNFALIFPELRDITGIFVGTGTGGTSSATVYTSADTTNSFDGNWTNHGSVTAFSPGNFVGANQRDAISSLVANGVKSVRISQSVGGAQASHGMHLYGAIATGETPDRLRIWHPTLDEALDDNTSADGAHLDWGDVVAGTTADKTFRVKNNSATLTANSINISTSVLTNTTPTLESQITYSDGGAFAPSIDIGNLAPGAISSLITVRKATDINATVWLWTWRAHAEATSWS